VPKVNVVTKEKDEEQLADVFFFTVAIKSLVTYRKGEEKVIPGGQRTRQQSNREGVSGPSQRGTGPWQTQEQEQHL
jgi:hypothetical protein